MASLTKAAQNTVAPRPKILVSDENGLSLFFAPREKQAFPQVLESSGLHVDSSREKAISQSASAGLLHGVE